MCRMLGYLGSPVLLDHFLYAPDSSLVKQAVDARMLGMLNLAGFGLAAWDDQSPESEIPLCYRSTQVAIFDQNLQALALKVRASALVAHLRGVPYRSNTQVNQESLHPFRFEGIPLVLAHNGELADFHEMRFDLIEHIRPEFAQQIHGSNDSAWIYALVVSALANPGGPLSADDIARAIAAALAVIRKARDRHGICRSSSVNLIAADGVNLVATRFTFDFGCFDEAPSQGGVDYLGQWYTIGCDYGLHDGEWKMKGAAGGADSVLVASEPLTRDTSTWLEVPEYSALLVSRDGAPCTGKLVALDA